MRFASLQPAADEPDGGGPESWTDRPPWLRPPDDVQPVVAPLAFTLARTADAPRLWDGPG